MKIAYLARQTSIHTVKWVNGMALRGHEVHLITMHPGRDQLHESVKWHILKIPPPLGYYLNTWEARRIIRRINPDILNAHYASGYGTLSRLVDFHPTLLSVWGSDVYDFPYESKWKVKILRKNLAAADQIASTSHAMKTQTENFAKPERPIAVTPFGVDTKTFVPNPDHKPNIITIGTVKKMDPAYGIEFLIRAFALLVEKNVTNIELILVGGGPQGKELKTLAVELNIDKLCHFIGYVPHVEVPIWLNRLNIYCAPSNSESFGVAVVEASACGIPVIVSDAGGLPEVVKNNVTGFIVPRRNPQAIAEAIMKLIEDVELRERMSTAGRDFVLQNYEWNENVSRMEKLYEKVIKNGHRRHKK